MWFKKNDIDIKQIERVEQKLNIQLPSFFVDFYIKKEKLIRKFKKLSNDEDYITLTTDFNWMIEFNRDFHKLPRTEGLCKNKICIGTDGCGNDSFISLDGNDFRVFKIDHEIANDLIDKESGDFMWEDDRMGTYDSLEHYLEEEIKSLKEFRN
ncbi:SMI1/KNR4 family protein [Aquimarina algiphila]|uniref:SMI1/KNR4 family protein n=1 Tax=Aquimarina algiphila TaxID=2047982 RepID=A0A554VB57_9FLAO|nr:SMI1/KNR4 family protein [Aquimarina algiphila]TSE03677.1 SMI1/KNR4 family protein [Aquimarina algiphila]